MDFFQFKNKTSLKLDNGWLLAEKSGNKAGYTATEVACGWAGAIFEVTRPFRQEL